MIGGYFLVIFLVMVFLMDMFHIIIKKLFKGMTEKWHIKFYENTLDCLLFVLSRRVQNKQ